MALEVRNRTRVERDKSTYVYPKAFIQPHNLEIGNGKADRDDKNYPYRKLEFMYSYPILEKYHNVRFYVYPNT